MTRIGLGRRRFFSVPCANGSQPELRRSSITEGLRSHESLWSRLRYFCSLQQTDSALYPVIGQMEHAAGLAHDDTARRKIVYGVAEHQRAICIASAECLGRPGSAPSPDTPPPGQISLS
jgi:hypothetical protein